MRWLMILRESQGLQLILRDCSITVYNRGASMLFYVATVQAFTPHDLIVNDKFADIAVWFIRVSNLGLRLSSF